MPIVRITLPAEKRALREKMRALGLGHREIAAEFARRYRLRPCAAWREAHGWSLREAAAQINAYTGTVGLDPGGISSYDRPAPVRARELARPRTICQPSSTYPADLRLRGSTSGLPCCLDLYVNRNSYHISNGCVDIHWLWGRQ